MPKSLLLTLLNLTGLVELLDTMCQLFGLPVDSTVAQCREAAMARLANAERATGITPTPNVDPLIRAQRLDAEGARMANLYRARRLVMGFNAQAEAIQNGLIEKIDDGATAGRAWGHFLSAQAAAKPHLEKFSGDAAAAMTHHSDADEVVDVEDLVSVPEAIES